MKRIYAYTLAHDSYRSAWKVDNSDNEYDNNNNSDANSNNATNLIMSRVLNYAYLQKLSYLCSRPDEAMFLPFLNFVVVAGGGS